MCNDLELMARVKLDDQGAFAILVQRHKSWLVGLLYHLFWSREEAEDGAQEVLLRVWLGRKQYEPRAALRTYLFTIARNYWHNRSTRGPRKQPLVSLEDQFGPGARVMIEEMADRSPTTEQVVMRRWELFQIRRAVDQLPEKQRLVFVLSQFGEMKYGEVAEVLGIPEGTVKSRMAAAVQSLRVRLASIGG